jgi:hypothetical protein
MQLTLRNAWIGVAMTAAVIAWAAPAAAQSAKNIRWCDREGGASPDQVIRGCTAILESGGQTRPDGAD